MPVRSSFRISPATNTDCQIEARNCVLAPLGVSFGDRQSNSSLLGPRSYTMSTVPCFPTHSLRWIRRVEQESICSGEHSGLSGMRVGYAKARAGNDKPSCNVSQDEPLPVPMIASSESNPSCCFPTQPYLLLVWRLDE